MRLGSLSNLLTPGVPALSRIMHSSASYAQKTFIKEWDGWIPFMKGPLDARQGAQSRTGIAHPLLMIVAGSKCAHLHFADKKTKAQTG